ncbi:extended-spectrum beta-lactamase PER-1 precursor [Methylomusa anaerophila]|uniref:Extended-spectrum beta-lactamase PER-1 n=2 Tax=Methylomusa anaerophila TaxID=1930071 RepID=A0A348AGG3_9FIRM|nr:extended-spectrum beta-lactamase PER-1 precursor [Methylomusa anaerophila]
MEILHRNIERILTAYTGRWGMVIVNQSTGARLELNPEMVFPAASMIKVPIMYEIMRQAAAGTISLDDSLTVTSCFRTGGAGILKELRPGLTLTVRELVTLMIILSDNTATNMLIDLAGMEAINKTITGLGLKSTVLRRRMMDFDAALAGKENYTSAADLALMFANIYHSRGLPESYGALMMDILTRQQIRDKLPFYLPAKTVMAHKTGTLTGVEHDAGILFLPGGPYIICVLTGDLAANQQGIQLVASIGKVIYEYFHKEK